MSFISNEMQTIFDCLEKALKAFGNLIHKTQTQTRDKTNQEALFLLAAVTVGKDASPRDLVNDDLGCAESLSTLISKIIKFPIITGTWTLRDKFERDPRFLRCDENNGRGTIVICSTSTGNGKIRGHCGILGDNQKIMSASSETSLWEVNYSLDSWNQRFKEYGGFKVHYFKLL